MDRGLFAELTILLNFDSIRSILFILGGVVISLLTFGTSKGNFDAHDGLPP